MVQAIVRGGSLEGKSETTGLGFVKEVGLKPGCCASAVYAIMALCPPVCFMTVFIKRAKIIM